MKIDQKRVGIYREKDLTCLEIKDELWSLIFTPPIWWWLISDQWSWQMRGDLFNEVWHVWVCVSHLLGMVGMKEWHYSIHVWSDKEHGLIIEFNFANFLPYRLWLTAWVCGHVGWVWSYWIVLDLGLEFVKEEPVCLLVLATGKGDPLKGVWAWHRLEGQNSEEWTFCQYICWDLGPVFECV